MESKQRGIVLMTARDNESDYFVLNYLSGLKNEKKENN